MIKLSTAPFIWKETEQVYPFEQGPNGQLAYCQKKEIGSMPNATTLITPTTSFVDSGKVIRFWGIARTSPGGVGGDTVTLPYVSNAYSSHWVLFTFPNSQFAIITGVDWRSYYATGYVIYYK